MKQIKVNDSVQEMFDACAEKHGTVFWDGIELALVESPYPDMTDDGDACFFALAMDREGNRWMVEWDILPDVDLEDADYCDQCDWDNPADAEIIDEGYYVEDEE
jgi:hypothetical protein